MATPPARVHRPRSQRRYLTEKQPPEQDGDGRHEKGRDTQFSGRCVAECVRPGREGKRSRHKSEVDDAQDLQPWCNCEIS